MSKTVSADEIKEFIGKETGISDWFNIDQDRINQFADVTIDHQFIHTDPERAKHSPFGTTIAHGFLTLSLFPHLSEEVVLSISGAKAALNYGFDKVRFMTPVKVGSNIRLRAKLTNAIEKGSADRLLLTYQITLEIEGEEKPALIADWLIMILM